MRTDSGYGLQGRLNSAARQILTLILFTTPLIAGLFLVVPGQGRAAVAAELILTGIVVGTVQVLR